MTKTATTTTPLLPPRFQGYRKLIVLGLVLTFVTIALLTDKLAWSQLQDSWPWFASILGPYFAAAGAENLSQSPNFNPPRPSPTPAPLDPPTEGAGD